MTGDSKGADFSAAPPELRRAGSYESGVRSWNSPPHAPELRGRGAHGVRRPTFCPLSHFAGAILDRFLPHAAISGKEDKNKKTKSKPNEPLAAEPASRMARFPVLLVLPCYE